MLEAQSCGIPVIAAKTQALVEIAGDSCLFFDPYNQNEIVDAINKLAKSTESKRRLINNGVLNSKKYSWAKAAKNTIEVYQNI